MTAEDQIPMPPGSVIITPAQMYVEIQDMGKKLDHLAAVIDPSLTSIRDDVNDHETRLRSIERRIYYVGGAVAVISVAASQALPYLTR